MGVRPARTRKEIELRGVRRRQQATVSNFLLLNVWGKNMKTKLMSFAASAVRNSIALAVLLTTLSILFAPEASAVPSYSRRYGVDCSQCHTMWGALNGGGQTFKLSGYRAINGKEIKPVSDDVELGKDGFAAIPTTLPLSFVTGVGYDYRTEKREASDGSSNDSTGSTFALEDASIFMTSPLGKHLSAFVEFPMYETRAWEFTPTGPFEANDTHRSNHIQFATEKPGFEVAKFFWNNIAGDDLPRDSVNLLFGITHPPLAFSPGKVRLDVNQYLIYERRALDLISPKSLTAMFGDERASSMFRLSEPQVLAEAMGMLTFGAPVEDVAKKETLWAEYHVGVSNGSNDKADNNTAKDLYGRWVMRYYNQSLGFFGYYSRDTYDNDLRTTGSIANDGIMSGAQSGNSESRAGIDFTFSLAPWGIPVQLQNQVMYNRDSNPTGFGKEFKWKGGSNELIWQASKKSVAYTRYDWIKGDTFNDTDTHVQGVTGITNTKPEEWDAILGFQHTLYENMKFIAEYRHHQYEDKVSGAKLSDDGFTTRLMIGF
jgi:hypothetical protein